MYYIIRFNLQKGEGHFPTRAELIEANIQKEYLGIIKSSLRFSFNNDNGLLPVIDWKLVDDGLSSLTLNDEGYDKGPQPVVWLYLEDEVDLEDEEKWSDALSSDYVLEFHGLNDLEPFYFQDHNGYSKVESAEWLADEIAEYLSDLAKGFSQDETVTYSDELLISRKISVNEEGVCLKLLLTYKEAWYSYIWEFLDEEALKSWEYSGNEYIDSRGCQAFEENPDVYAIHSLLVQNR